MAKISKKWKDDQDRWSIDQEWSGTAVIYAASQPSSFFISGDYQVSFENESEPDDMRAVRLHRACQGKLINEVPHDKLADDLVVIFGSKMTASKAVQTLKSLVARIEDQGLVVGRIGMGDFIREMTGKDLTINDAQFFDTEE